MKPQRINISFGRLSDANFEITSKHIYEQMNGNAYFPAPNPTVPVLLAATTRYSTALVAARELGKNPVAEKNASRYLLAAILTQMGMGVMNTANGDVQQLISSGFELTKQPEPRHITNPGTVTVVNGRSSGQLQVSVKSVKNASLYVFEFTDQLPTDKTVWTSIATSTSKFTLTGLQPGKQYWVRVIVVGSRQQRESSTIGSQYAQ